MSHFGEKMARHFTIRCGRFQFDLANITVEPVLFLYMFTSFLYFPALQSLIFMKVCVQDYTAAFCDDIQHNETFKKEHEKESDYVSSETSFWILKSNVAQTVTSFFVVILFLGAVGDKYGRKFPVILPCFGAFASYLSALLNAKYISASLYYVLIGPIVNGLCGGYIACLMAVYSFIGHISTPASKMTRVGILESMVFLSGTIGVFVSGLMLDNQGYVFTFSAQCIIIGVALLYTAVWLENVRSPNSENQRESCLGMMFNFLRNTFQCVVKRRERNVFSAVLLQIVSIDILMLCTSGDMDISLLYLKDKFTFSLTLFGYLKGLDNFLRGIIMITFVPIIKKLTMVRDLPLVMFGLLSYAAAFVITGAAYAKWMVFLGAVVGMYKGIPSAGLRASMSSLVSTEEQGRLFGLIAASESVISLLASVIFNILYPATRDIFPGLCYIIGAALLLLVFAVVVYVHRILPGTRPQQGYRTIEEDNEPENTSVLNTPTGDDDDS